MNTRNIASNSSGQDGIEVSPGTAAGTMLGILLASFGVALFPEGVAAFLVAVGIAKICAVVGLVVDGELTYKSESYESAKGGAGEAFGALLPSLMPGVAKLALVTAYCAIIDALSNRDKHGPGPSTGPGGQKGHWEGSKWIPDPLALDLDGNGIAFTKNGAYFDLGTDGFAERATWIGKGDGLLALDKNNDGKINNGSELFGDAMKKKDGTLAKDGFDALTDYDLNKDGKIDAADDVYSKLRVWVDANGDGVTDDGELKTLAELGIRQLNLGNTAGNGVVNATGEVLQKQGSFIWENGAVRDEFVFRLEHRKILVLQREN